MKFKFCGDGDCPLWALAALHALSSLPAQLFRALLQRLLDNDDDAAMELLKDTGLGSRAESARAFAAIRWVLVSAWSCACKGPALARDLAVLAVPRAHALALADAVDEHREAYVEGLKTTGFGVNKLTDISISAAPEGAGDTYKLTLQSQSAGEHSRTDLLIESSQAKDLLKQLKLAYKKMEELEGSQE